MSEFTSTPALTLLPAVDVADGKAVRLTQGEAGTETSYGDPVDAATDWVSGLAGVTVLAKHDGRVVVAVDGDEQRVLDAARAAGRVILFSAVQPTLTDLFRQAVQA